LIDEIEANIGCQASKHAAQIIRAQKLISEVLVLTQRIDKAKFGDMLECARATLADIRQMAFTINLALTDALRYGYEVDELRASLGPLWCRFIEEAAGLLRYGDPLTANKLLRLTGA